MKIAMLMAKTPGQLWAMAIRSSISSFDTHPFLFTTSSSIKGIMAYPPPRVNMPILKKEVKASPNPSKRRGALLLLLLFVS